MKKKITAKFLKVMKICTLQTIIALVVCGVSIANTNYAQLLDKRITLNISSTEFEDALKIIEETAGVRFIYSPDQLDHEPEVTLRVQAKTLQAVLDELLTSRAIKYKVHEKEASITLKKDTDSKNINQSINNSVHVGSWEFQITGTVTDGGNQQPMAGVNVVVKGTTNGTTTDADGRFTISANAGDVLVFSFIGYSSAEVTVSEQTIIAIVLREDIQNLKEVVVNAGYYTITKENRTGNISKVAATDIEKQPVSNPLASLAGRVAGLEIIQQNGVPGGNFKVRIRGTNSIANGNDPLYIIDGVPFTSASMSFAETSGNILGSPSPLASRGSSPLNSLNPADIESIEILKDADATAIYGSRGANGVILITTKKGKAGETKVDFNFYSGVAQFSRQVDLLTTPEYVEMRREAYKNDNTEMTTGDAPDFLTWDTTRNTNWQKELIGGSARITDAQVAISGGERNTQFLIGTGFHRETTVFPGSNFDQRISLHSNLSNTSTDQKFKTSFSVNYSISIANLPGEDLTNRALTLPPNAPPLYDEKGKISWDEWTISENPLAYTKRIYESTTNNLISNGSISYAIMPSLEVKANLGFTDIKGEGLITIPISSQNPAIAGNINRSIFSESSFQNWIVEPQLDWKPRIDHGVLNVLVGSTFLDQRSEGLAQYAHGFSSEALMKNLAAAPAVIAATNYYSQYRYHALFGRINYSYNDRYMINVTGRRDGSSRFGPGKQFAVFGAVGAAWIFSRETFVKNSLPFISFGKLRASFGTTGNDQIGDYQFLDTYTRSGTYQGQIGLSPVRLNNPGFAWETNQKIEGGIELSFLENKISTTASFYRNRSSNQLVGFPLAPTTGFTSIQGNFPAVVENSGVEIEVSSINIQTSEKLTWTSALNLTIPRNRLMKFPDLALFPEFANTYVVGEPLEIQKAYRFTGVDNNTGVYQFEDLNGDGVYTTEDRTTVKFVGRNFFGGLENTFQYKGLRLTMLVQYVRQQGFTKTNLFYDAPGMLSNQPEDVVNRWRAPGSDAEIQRYTIGYVASEYLMFRNSAEAIGDASYFRLKNLSLSYSIPAKWLKEVYLSNASIFLQGQNLLTSTKYEGLDPEVPGSANLPPLRTVTLGAHLTF
jgi:TonB-dependent starch-binding outer membrane protein SusC